MLAVLQIIMIQARPLFSHSLTKTNLSKQKYRVCLLNNYKGIFNYMKVFLILNYFRCF